MKTNSIILLSLVLTACHMEAEIIDTSGQMTPTCEEAALHFEACTDTPVTALYTACDAEEAERILDTPCEVLSLAYAYDGDVKADKAEDGVYSLTCRWFNIGCPPETGCLSTLSDEAKAQVIALSEPTSLTDPYDARARVEEIAYIFRDEGDPRGLFATVYRLITNRAVASVEEGDYEYEEWANALITEFARRYLTNLHGHLTGGEVTGQWEKYYGLAQDCNVGRARTLGVAIAVHLMVDLPYTLHKIGSQPEQREDFVLFGDILLQIFPQLIIDIQADYDTDVYPLLNGFLFGEWVDNVGGEGTMTAFLYQGVRLKAWRDGQNLNNFPEFLVRTEILASWGLAEKILAKLDHCDAI